MIRHRIAYIVGSEGLKGLFEFINLSGDSFLDNDSYWIADKKYLLFEFSKEGSGLEGIFPLSGNFVFTKNSKFVVEWWKLRNKEYKRIYGIP